MKRLSLLLSTLGLALVSTSAFADETATTKNATTTLAPILIEGRTPRPVAAVEVARTRMELGIRTPTLSGASRIQDAAKKEPF